MRAKTIHRVTLMIALGTPHLVRAQTPPIVVPCNTDGKTQQASQLVAYVAAHGNEGLQMRFASSVPMQERSRMREQLDSSAQSIATLYRQYELSVVIVFPEADLSIYRCRFIGDNEERFRLDLHYRTTECVPEIIGMRIDREPAQDPSNDLPPEPPPMIEDMPFIIQPKNR